MRRQKTVLRKTGFLQRDSVEHEEYAGAQSSGIQLDMEKGVCTLLEEIASPANMKQAFERVVRNNGSPGIDKMTVKELEPWCRKYPNEISSKLLKGKYKVSPVLRVEIDKPDGGKRKLGIPTVKDRLVQQSVNQVLQGIYEPLFSDSSFGYRIGRGAGDAIKRVRDLVEEGYNYVVEMDLSKYFDTINHELMLNLLRRQVKDERVIRLIKWFLKSGVMENGMESDTDKGAPQGGPLSPLLSNIYLDVFDKEMEKRGVPSVRYADDIIIFAKSQRAAERLMGSARKILEGRLRLRINEEKTRVISVYSGKFKFLGFGIGKNGQGIFIKVHKKSIIKAKRKLKRLTGRNQGNKPLELIFRKLKEYASGWLNYFGIAKMKGLIQSLNEWVRRRIRMIIWKRWKLPRTRIRNLMKMGISKSQAYQWGNTRKGYWRISRSPILTRTLGNKKLIANGYYDLSINYERIHSKY